MEGNLDQIPSNSIGVRRLRSFSRSAAVEKCTLSSVACCGAVPITISHYYSRPSILSKVLPEASTLSFALYLTIHYTPDSIDCSLHNLITHFDNNMAGNNPRIIPLEEGWNDEIKAKVSPVLCSWVNPKWVPGRDLYPFTCLLSISISHLSKLSRPLISSKLC
jgi:hypothetical protein